MCCLSVWMRDRGARVLRTGRNRSLCSRGLKQVCGLIASRHGAGRIEWRRTNWLPNQAMPLQELIVHPVAFRIVPLGITEIQECLELEFGIEHLGVTTARATSCFPAWPLGRFRLLVLLDSETEGHHNQFDTIATLSNCKRQGDSWGVPWQGLVHVPTRRWYVL